MLWHFVFQPAVVQTGLVLWICVGLVVLNRFCRLNLSQTEDLLKYF